MGVLDLLLFIRKFRKDLAEQVDLVTLAKQQPIEILVDGSSILHTLYVKFLDALCKETKNWYIPINGGEYALFDMYVYRFVKAMKDANITTIWYFDGVRGVFEDEDDVENQIEKWKASRKWEADRITAAWDLSKQSNVSDDSLSKLRRQANINEPLLLQVQLARSIRRAGGRVFQKVYGDADKWMVRHFHRFRELRKVVAILSDDSDFAIFPGVNFISLKYNMFDVTHELRLHHVLSGPYSPSPVRLVCLVVRTAKLAQILQLNFDQLAEFAALCGNDFTRRFRKELLQAAGIQLNSGVYQLLFFQIAEFLRQRHSLWNSEQICQLTFAKYAVRKALERSRSFYDLEENSETNSVANSEVSAGSVNDTFDDDDDEDEDFTSDEEPATANDDAVSVAETNLDAYDPLDDKDSFLTPAVRDRQRFLNGGSEDLEMEMLRSLLSRVRGDRVPCGYPVQFVSIYRGFYWSLSPPIFEVPLTNCHADSFEYHHKKTSGSNAAPTPTPLPLPTSNRFEVNESATATSSLSEDDKLVSKKKKKKKKSSSSKPSGKDFSHNELVEMEIGNFELRLRPLRRILYAFFTLEPVQEFILPAGPYDYVLAVSDNSHLFTKINSAFENENFDLFIGAMSAAIDAFKHGITVATKPPPRPLPGALDLKNVNNLDTTDSENESASLPTRTSNSKDTNMSNHNPSIDYFEICKNFDCAFRMYLLHLMLEIDNSNASTANSNRPESNSSLLISRSEFDAIFCALFTLAKSSTREETVDAPQRYQNLVEHLDLLANVNFPLQPSARCLVLFGRLQLIYEYVRWFASLFFIADEEFPEPRVLFNGLLFSAFFACTDAAMRVGLNEEQQTKVTELSEDLQVRFQSEYNILVREFFDDATILSNESDATEHNGWSSDEQ